MPSSAYNHMALMSLRSRSHVNASIILTRADHLYIQLYKITSRYYFKTYFNGPDKARTHILLLVCLTPWLRSFFTILLKNKAF